MLIIGSIIFTLLLLYFILFRIEIGFWPRFFKKLNPSETRYERFLYMLANFASGFFFLILYPFGYFNDDTFDVICWQAKRALKRRIKKDENK